MKWLLAASQLALLLNLQRRCWTVRLPALRSFLVFAVLSSIFYNPWKQARFEWLSIPSVTLRTWVLFECFHLLTSGRYAPLRSLMLAAQCIGGLILLSGSWAIVERYEPGVTLAIYCTVVIAGAFWTMLGAVWLFIEHPGGWVWRYSLAVGFYFAVLAITRVSHWDWTWTNNAAMGLYAAIFLWLAKHLFQHRNKLLQRDGAEYY